MKKVLKNKRYMVVAISIIVFLLLILGIAYFGCSGKTEDEYNKYKISSKQKDLPGTDVIKSDTLSSEHCFEDICVSDLVIYNNTLGRMEYKITNKGSKEANGYLKMNFGDKSIIIFYQTVAPGKSVTSYSQFNGEDYGDVVDYFLEELTKEEMEKINVQ